MRALVPLFLGLLAAPACASPPASVRGIGPLVLHDSSGTPRPLDAELGAHAYTVVTFFSSHCPCQRAHDARIRDLIAKETPLGVGFVVVDSAESAVATDREESKARGYPIVLDDAGKLARAVGAEYATFSVVLDREGRILYRGGFDSDRTHLRDDATPYLANALDDLQAGRPVRAPETKALGCMLELP
jgi:hypothetical protein